MSVYFLLSRESCQASVGGGGAGAGLFDENPALNKKIANGDFLGRPSPPKCKVFVTNVSSLCCNNDRFTFCNRLWCTFMWISCNINLRIIVVASRPSSVCILYFSLTTTLPGSISGSFSQGLAQFVMLISSKTVLESLRDVALSSILTLSVLSGQSVSFSSYNINWKFS